MMAKTFIAEQGTSLEIKALCEEIKAAIRSEEATPTMTRIYGTRFAKAQRQ